MTQLSLVPPALEFSTDFSGANGRLPAPWVDGTDTHPLMGEPIGQYNGAAVIRNHRTRSGTYQPNQWISPPSPAGTLYGAIGCAYIETNRKLVDISYTWTGKADIPSTYPTANSHVEGTALIYVDLDNPLGGFGIWPAIMWGTPVWLWGYMGSPVELFWPQYLSAMTSHVENQPCVIRMVTPEVGKVLVYKDGVQQPHPYPGLDPLDPYPIDSSLLHSTKHGFELDGHYVYPQETVTTAPGLLDFTMKASGPVYL